METWVTKLIVLILMAIIALVCGLLPIKLVRFIRRRHHPDNEEPEVAGGLRTTADRVLDGLNCLAGGVFLTTSLLHLLPDVRKDVEKVKDAIGDVVQTEFPLAEFVACVGFFLVMLLEEILTECQQRTNGNIQHQVPAAVTSPAAVDDERRPFLASRQIIAADSDHQKQHDQSTLLLLPPNSSFLHHSGHYGNGKTLTTSTVYGSAVLLGRPNSMPGQRHDALLHEAFHISVVDGVAQKPGGGGGGSNGIIMHQHSLTTRSKCDVDVTADVRRGGTVVDRAACDDAGLKSIRSFVLLLALAIHTIFEGLAIGLQESTAEIWTLFLAVALHKSVMSFTSGLRFAETLPTVGRAVLYVVVFSLMSPLGIGIGLVVSELGQHGLATDVASAVLQGLATGTFIYVTFFEVLHEQLSHDGRWRRQGGGRGTSEGVAKVLAVVVGFAAVAVLELFMERLEG